MENFERNERWQKVRDYAMGKEKASQFKEIFRNSENYVGIDWHSNKVIDKIIRKVLGRHRQYIQNIKVIQRLKQAGRFQVHLNFK